MNRTLLTLGLGLFGGPALLAQDVEPDEAEILEANQQFEASLDYQTGTLVLGDDLATLHLDDSLRYLEDGDARRVLEDAWGNPPGGPTLGLLVPGDRGVLDADAWAVIITFEEEGLVEDDDAGDIDYDDLLATMKEQTKESNEARAAQGYESLELIGWATEPRYDAESKKLYWAKELEFGGRPNHTLNYNIRILGRRGVLVLNAVGAMDQLAEIESATPGLLKMVEFNEGHRYADFDPSIDKVAAYGIGGLIAGKVALKVGLFKVILLALAKGWKLVLIGVAVAGGLLAKLLGRSKAAPGTPAEGG